MINCKTPFNDINSKECSFNCHAKDRPAQPVYIVNKRTTYCQHARFEMVTKFSRYCSKIIINFFLQILKNSVIYRTQQ